MKQVHAFTYTTRVRVQVLKVDHNNLVEIPSLLGRLDRLTVFCCASQRPRVKLLPGSITRLHQLQATNVYLFIHLCIDLLGPFHGAIAVPPVTRCRCRRCRGHRCAGSARQYRYRHLVNWREAARCGEWAQHFSNASCLFIYYVENWHLQIVTSACSESRKCRKQRHRH